MRALVVSAVVLAALAVGWGDGSATAGSALTVTVWPQGREEGTSMRWTLRCGPVGGTHPRRRSACARLASLKDPFRPVPRDAVCTQVFGGPQEVLVTGVHRGRRVWTRFNRKNGCQISRWNRHVPLLPAAEG